MWKNGKCDVTWSSPPLPCHKLSHFLRPPPPSGAWHTLWTAPREPLLLYKITGTDNLRPANSHYIQLTIFSRPNRCRLWQREEELPNEDGHDPLHIEGRNKHERLCSVGRHVSSRSWPQWCGNRTAPSKIVSPAFKNYNIFHLQNKNTCTVFGRIETVGWLRNSRNYKLFIESRHRRCFSVR